MLNSVVRLSHVRPGFDPDRLLTFNVALTGPRYAAADARVSLISRLVDRANATSGVRGAAVSSLVPFSGRRNANTVEIEGHVRAPGELSMIIDQRYVSTDYLQLMRIPLLNGRFLDANDGGRSEPVTVINRTMAQRYFPDGNPIDRRVRTTVGFDSGVWFRVVGVVDDVRHVALNSDPVPEMYRPIAQTASPLFTVVVRTAGDPAAMAPALRAAVQSVDADLPIADVRTMDDRIAGIVRADARDDAPAGRPGRARCGAGRRRDLRVDLVSVVQRTPEIALRVALGASRAALFREIVGSALALGGTGAALGVAGGIASGRLLQTMLFDTKASDPWTHASVAAGRAGVVRRSKPRPRLARHARGPSARVARTVAQAFRPALPAGSPKGLRCASADTTPCRWTRPARSRRHGSPDRSTVGEHRARADAPRHGELGRAREHVGESDRHVDQQTVAHRGTDRRPRFDPVARPRRAIDGPCVRGIGPARRSRRGTDLGARRADRGCFHDGDEAIRRDSLFCRGLVDSP